MYSSGFRNIRRALAVFLCAVLLLTFFSVSPSTTQKAIAATT